MYKGRTCQRPFHKSDLHTTPGQPQETRYMATRVRVKYRRSCRTCTGIQNVFANTFVYKNDPQSFCMFEKRNHKWIPKNDFYQPQNRGMVVSTTGTVTHASAPPGSFPGAIRVPLIYGTCMLINQICADWLDTTREQAEIEGNMEAIAMFFFWKFG
jgi:hypothetical protein